MALQDYRTMDLHQLEQLADALKSPKLVLEAMAAHRAYQSWLREVSMFTIRAKYDKSVEVISTADTGSSTNSLSNIATSCDELLESSPARRKTDDA